MPLTISRTSNFYTKKLSVDIDSAIAGLTANDSTKNIFTTMQPNGNCCLGDSSTDPVNPVFIRSTTCWAKNIDTSPISPWNNGGGYPIETSEHAGGFGGTGTLISPRHILFANHFRIKIGKKLIFVDMNNTCYIRTLTNSLNVFNQLGSTDIQIGVLDSDLPSNVSFCKVASFDFSTLAQFDFYNPSPTWNKIPVFYTDQERKALIALGYGQPSAPESYFIEPPNYLSTSQENIQRANFYEVPIGGDSGCPVCFVYNNKLILLFTFTAQWAGSSAPYHINAINSAMTTLGGGYTLSLFNKNDIISQEKNISIKTQNSPTNYRKILSAGIDSAIAGRTANNSTKLIFSTQTPNNGVNPVYVRSNTCWAKNIDLSPLSPWNSSGNTQEGGTLISPRHIVFANHFTIPNGSTLIFVDMNNNSYTRTLSNQAQVTGTDIQIGVLDSDLPSNVSFCQVSSLELADFPTNSNRVPVLYTDQEEKALVGDFYNIGNIDLGGNLQYAGGLFTPADSQRASFYETVISGDSGDPIGFVYNNKYILLFTFYSANFGPNLGYYLNEINSVMTSLGGGYTLSIFNKEDALGSGRIISNKNYILNSQFNADNQYPISDGSLFFDNNFGLDGLCYGFSNNCGILTNYQHNSPLLYEELPYGHTFANRTFHEINSPYDILPIGHPIQPRLLKMFGAGSLFGKSGFDYYRGDFFYLKTITNTTSFSPNFNQSWAKYGVEQSVIIPSWATKVVYGVKYLAKSDDLFRDNNFAGLKLNFRLPDIGILHRNYVNVHLIRRSTASAVDTLESLYGSNVYTYFDADREANAMSQWLGPNVSRVKVRKRSSTIIDSNTNQFIKIKDTIDIPTFSSSSAEPDFGNGRPYTVSLEMFFAEWLTNLDDNPNISTGSIYFYEPFIYFL